MSIVILDDYQDAVRKLACASKLDAYPAKVYTNTPRGLAQLCGRLRGAEAVVLIRQRTAVTRELLQRLPELRLVAQTGHVGDHIDLQACTEHGVAVAEGAGSALPAAELTWALMMAAMRRLPQYIANLKHGVWQQSGLKSTSMPPNFCLGNVLKGRRLGIWGYGHIGRLVAGYGKAFGMEVTIWGSQASMAAARSEGFSSAPSRAEFFALNDVLSLHLRLVEQTRGIVTADDLARMKPSSLLVNTARAGLIQPGALAAALQQGRPGMAAVDVYDSEPILPGHSLLRLENCICTPHIGYVEKDNYERYFSAAFDNVVHFLQGHPTNILNPEVLSQPVP